MRYALSFFWDGGFCCFAFSGGEFESFYDSPVGLGLGFVAPFGLCCGGSGLSALVVGAEAVGWLGFILRGAGVGSSGGAFACAAAEPGESIF